MSDEVKHTPTPWIIEYGHMQQHNDIRYWQITDGQDAICNNQFCFASDSAANAAHIVKCVNLHDELVAVMSDIHDFLKRSGYDTTMVKETLKKAGVL